MAELSDTSSFTDAQPSRSESEQSLLNGDYSTLQDAPSGSSGAHDDTYAAEEPCFRLATLPPPNSTFMSDGRPALQVERKHQHSTWARTFHSRPALYVRPRSVEEVQKTVMLARTSRKRIVTVGSAHSPSDLTCTSAWMLDLRDMRRVLDVKKDEGDGQGRKSAEKGALRGSGEWSFASEASTVELAPPGQRQGGRMLVEAGISLHDLNVEAAKHGLTIPNLGSIDVQSVAGAIATGTHGSSLRHGLLSTNVRGLRIVLSDGRAVWCTRAQYGDLFRAALVSLGALGVITEIEVDMVPATDIEWTQTIVSMDTALGLWDKNLWTQAEFVRCWLLPYSRRMVIWKADKTNKPRRKPKEGWYGGWFGFQTYRFLLWTAHYIPRLCPFVEWLVFGLQYGFSNGATTSAVEEQRTGLLMDCLYSQFVNEWAIPLHKGPEALKRITGWIAGDDATAKIPLSAKDVWIHCPIEVRVVEGSSSDQDADCKAFLDPTEDRGPTLYLNAIMYRPFGCDPKATKKYYEGFEWLMKELGGRPHWAKCFQTVTAQDVEDMYGEKLRQWRRVRDDVDVEGMFVGPWHRDTVMPRDKPQLKFEEQKRGEKVRSSGGIDWSGAVREWERSGSPPEDSTMFDFVDV